MDERSMGCATGGESAARVRIRNQNGSAGAGAGK